MTVIGRRDELDRIAETAVSLCEGALLIVGEPGGGKSWLLEQAQGRAAIRSVLVRAMRAERSWPLSGLARAFAFVSAVDVRSFGTSAWRGPAPRMSLAPADDRRDGGDRFSAARELLSALRTPEPEPLLVLIDDIDEMDDESQLLLGYMAEGLAGTGVRIVASATAVPSASPLAAFRRISLDPLSASESCAVAIETLGPDSDSGTAHILAEVSGGSPAAIVRGAAAMSAAQRRGDEPLSLPLRPTEETDRLVAQRLAGVEPDSLRLLEFVSLAAWTEATVLLDVVAVPASGAAAAAAGRHTTDADRLDDLEYAGLITRSGSSVRVGDPRLRSWLYWSMAPSVRRKRHRRLGIAHHRVDARLEQWHRSFTEDSSDLVEELLRAADRCVVHGETTAAVEFAERALRLASATSDHQPLIRALSRTLLEHGFLELAARYAENGGAHSMSAPAAVDVAALRIAIEYARTHVVPTHAIDAVVGLYSGNGMPELARLLAVAASYHAERWELDEARRYLALAAREVGVHEVSAHEPNSELLMDRVAALTDALAGVSAFDAVGPAPTEVPAAELTELSAHTLLLLGSTLTYREEYARARHVFALVITQPHIHAPIWIEMARFHLAVNEIRSGRFHSARVAVEDWMACVSPSTANTSSRLYLRAWYLYSSGSVADANALFGECMDRTLSERNPAVAAMVLATQGAVALAEGDYAEATRLLELADIIGSRFTNPALLRGSIDLIEAYVASSRLREARGVVMTLERAQGVSPSRWLMLAIARGRALTAADDQSLALYQRALELCTPDDSPFERGRTLTSLATAQARLGFVRESEKSLAAAHTAFSNAGSLVWARRVGQGRVAETEPGTVAGILTEEEQLIVEKVREGYRNKEIAAELFISLRTVELRLTHIYRKVGARSRSHLAALLN